MEHTVIMPRGIEHLLIEGNRYYKISNSDDLRPFFMSIVSESDHWMFISSNGGLTAGRRNAEFSLFPYYTDDKVTESAEITGSKSIFLIKDGGQQHLWEPFSYRYEGMYQVSRNLYKSAYGHKLIFEEINHDLDLTFTYEWNTSNTFGFIKRSKVTNNANRNYEISLLDGLQNIMPYGVSSDLQNAASNLVDAYKRSELDEETGIGIFALSAIIVDKAEPSEALKANIAWSIGLDNPKYLLSSKQLNNFRRRKGVTQELDVKAEKGAYFVNADIALAAGQTKEWLIIADVNKTHTKIAKLSQKILNEKDLYQQISDKVELGTKRLIQLVGSSDGIQLTADKYRDTRHFSNVLFNIMRGGIFDHNYQIEKWDFDKYLAQANKQAHQSAQKYLSDLEAQFNLSDLKKIIEDTDDKALQRLSQEYLPLRFSRRHGDPSRPWNKFSINTRTEDGEKILDYEGNWRDIFQNWEALAHSYPDFIESMIHKFLNASTFDGYNPYRVTKDGFDWETIEPDNPWSYIGYWGDHQIIYLQKFLEFMEDLAPGKLASLFDKDMFVYAHVPYRIKSYQDIVNNSKDTIEFDEPADHAIRQEREKIGADGALLKSQKGHIYTVNYIEKILATTLAKVSNFIPEAGIWMNTQRPEWNDANNALVGNGVSMVTLYYLRRFMQFFHDRIADSGLESVDISNELFQFFQAVHTALADHKDIIGSDVNDQERRKIIDALGEAASKYRLNIYEHSFIGEKSALTIEELKYFTQVTLSYLDQSIKANKREDNLYHAYNLITMHEDEAEISYLNEMLEGQVAVLSSGCLSSTEALSVLDGMKRSKLFREDQYSYLLYPNKDLPKFLDRNTIPSEAVTASQLLSKLVADDNRQILTQDVKGEYHFNGNFKNADDLAEAISSLDNQYDDLRVAERQQILQVWEDMFNHKAFTGRSGTFYGYEGLGSIYWHMVSKLLLAVQECCLKAIQENASAETIGKLLEHYYEINEGIGVHKPAELYGAFPTDPYSHTPAGKGAQQPGMTGQVKEDILSRFGELGVFVSNGKLVFNPCLLRKDEFLQEPKSHKYSDVNLQTQELNIEANSLCFTYCQVPVIYRLSDQLGLKVSLMDNSFNKYDQLSLDAVTSRKIFERTGEVQSIEVFVTPEILK